MKFYRAVASISENLASHSYAISNSFESVFKNVSMGKKEFMRVFIWLLSLQDILVNFKIRWEQDSPNRFDGKKYRMF